MFDLHDVIMNIASFDQRALDNNLKPWWTFKLQSVPLFQKFWSDDKIELFELQVQLFYKRLEALKKVVAQFHEVKSQKDMKAI